VTSDVWDWPAALEEIDLLVFTGGMREDFFSVSARGNVGAN
jgi:hypothetical protein